MAQDTVSQEGLQVLVTGGTGFIGRPLVARLLELGNRVTVYTRDVTRARALLPAGAVCCGNLAELPDSAIFDVLINLAGESLAAGRWTARKKQRLYASRIDTTSELLAWARRARVKPGYLLNASAVGAYGPSDARPLNETSAAVAPSFGQGLCQAWEEMADCFADAGVPVCKLRLGVVFARRGGAFTSLRRPFDFKVAVRMGRGDPYCSWIHRDDLIRAVEFLLARRPLITGVVNLTAPQPLTYAEMARQLGRARKTWFNLALPAPLLRLALGEMADELLLSGQNVLPERLQALGFTFRYPNLASALPDLL